MASYKIGIDTKKKIYTVSKELFYKNGYNDTKINDILFEANVNKGSFYYHYPNGKSEIGLLIYREWMEFNRLAALLIAPAEADELINFCVQFRVLWDRVFKDGHLRKFIIDLTRERLTYTVVIERIYELCKEKSIFDLEPSSYYLISSVMNGVSDQLFYVVDNKSNEYTSEGIADFYIRTLFDMYFIPSRTTHYISDESKQLFSKLNINNKEFNIIAALR